ncbi:MAG: carboxypeptidase-like regulatory domain-containing protein [bacterium]
MSRNIAMVTACVALLCAGAYAAEPPGKPEESGPADRQLRQEEGAPLGMPEQFVSGTVTDYAGKPLGGVVIKLFADGDLVRAAHTTANGAFEMPMPLNVEGDETVVLWFVSTTEPLQPQFVVLKQSSRAKSNRLFSPCALSAKMRPQMRVDVRLLTENEEMAVLKGKGCL